MGKINPDKLKDLKTVDQLFDEKYGKDSNQRRTAFEAESAAWYFEELMGECHK